MENNKNIYLKNIQMIYFMINFYKNFQIKVSIFFYLFQQIFLNIKMENKL